VLSLGGDFDEKKGEGKKHVSKGRPEATVALALAKTTCHFTEQKEPGSGAEEQGRERAVPCVKAR